MNFAFEGFSNAITLAYQLSGVKIRFGICARQFSSWYTSGDL